MKIITIKNKRDEKILREKTADFDFGKLNQKEIKKLIDDMRKQMIEAQGIGLAANQIGMNVKIFVAQIPNEKGGVKFYAIFNPKIEKISSSKSVMEEGCLSVPETYGEVERPEKITLTGYDQNGKKIKIKAWDLLARVFQHEVDHLNGKLFIDKAKNLRTITNDHNNDNSVKSHSQ